MKIRIFFAVRRGRLHCTELVGHSSICRARCVRGVIYVILARNSLKSIKHNLMCRPRAGIIEEDYTVLLHLVHFGHS